LPGKHDDRGNHDGEPDDESFARERHLASDMNERTQ
jgi:hypothetical protein